MNFKHPLVDYRIVEVQSRFLKGTEYSFPSGDDHPR